MDRQHIDDKSAGIIAEMSEAFAERALVATTPEEKLYNEFMAAISGPFGKVLYSSVVMNSVPNEIVWDAITNVAGALVAEAVCNLAPKPEGVDFKEIGEIVADIVRHNVNQRHETTIGRIELPRA